MKSRILAPVLLAMVLMGSLGGCANDKKGAEISPYNGNAIPPQGATAPAASGSTPDAAVAPGSSMPPSPESPPASSPVACTPRASCPAPMNCGTVDNGCGGTTACGTCEPWQTCGFGGAVNVCGPALPPPPTPPSACGSGTIETGESCDDANTRAGDGCSPTCQTESGWDCHGTPSACCMTDSCAGYCGYRGRSCAGARVICPDCTAPGEFCGAGGTPNVCAAAPVYRFGFVSYRDGFSNLYLQDSGETPRTSLMTNNRMRTVSHSRISFRPDGQRIAFNTISTLLDPQPWAVIGRDFEMPTVVFNPLDRDPEDDGVDNYIPYSVDWNETGDKIAFLAKDITSGRNALMVDMLDPENADHTHVEVPNDGGTREFDKVVWWHWNGAAETRLLFSMKEGREPYDLYVRDMSNPAGLIRRIDFGGTGIYDKKDPSVGPFAQLAFVLVTPAGSHLATCNLNFSWSPPICGSLTYHHNTLAPHVSSPSWSPDGRYLFFVSDHDGNPEIYMMSLTSYEVKRLTDNRVQDSDVACLPAPPRP